MSAVPSNVASLSATQGICKLSGRVTSARKITTQRGPMHLTVVKLPAPDEFTSPGVVELRSAASLGRPGDDWSGNVRVSGYGRSYDQTDPQTGDKYKVQSAQITLDVL